MPRRSRLLLFLLLTACDGGGSGLTRAAQGGGGLLPWLDQRYQTIEPALQDPVVGRDPAGWLATEDAIAALEATLDEVDGLDRTELSWRDQVYLDAFAKLLNQRVRQLTTCAPIRSRIELAFSTIRVASRKNQALDAGPSVADPASVLQQSLEEIASIPAFLDLLEREWSVDRSLLPPRTDLEWLRQKLTSLVDDPDGNELVALIQRLDEAQVARFKESFANEIGPRMAAFADLLTKDIIPAATDHFASSSYSVSQRATCYPLEIELTLGAPFSPTELMSLGTWVLADSERRTYEILRDRYPDSTPEVEVGSPLAPAIKAAIDPVNAELERSLPSNWDRDTYVRELVARGIRSAPLVFAHDLAVPLEIEIADDPAGQFPSHYVSPTSQAEEPHGTIVFELGPDDLPLSHARSAFHEGLPGHHALAATSFQLAGRLPRFLTVRNASSASFGEGWASYSEDVAAELELYDRKLAEDLGYLGGIRGSALSVVCNVAIHELGWSGDEVRGLWQARSSVGPEAIEARVSRGRSLQVLTYLVGKTRIQAMRERYEAALGDRADLREFHSFLMTLGSMDVAQAEHSLELWLASGGGELGGIRRELFAADPAE